MIAARSNGGIVFAVVRLATTKPGMTGIEVPVQSVNPVERWPGQKVQIVSAVASVPAVLLPVDLGHANYVHEDMREMAWET